MNKGTIVCLSWINLREYEVETLALWVSLYWSRITFSMKRYWISVVHIIIIIVFTSCAIPDSIEPTEITYGPEFEISSNWIIDNETVVVTAEQPIHFVQDYHEEHKIIVKNGGCLKILSSYIRSDFRYLLELYDNSKLIVENSQLIDRHRELSGAVIINLDSSVVQANNSELDFVGIASGNQPPSYTTVDLSNSNIRQLQIDLFDIAPIVVEEIEPGSIEAYTISSERFIMTLKNVNITGGIVSWTGNVDATFKNVNFDQISPDHGSKLNITKSTIREIAPRVTGYSGLISNLPSGAVSSFRLDLPMSQGPSLHIVDSTIEKGWYFRYWESNIEFRNCYFSVLRPMGYNHASVYDSIVDEFWIWDTSGEISFRNSSIGWIGNVMNYPGYQNDILLSGDFAVKDKDWRKRLHHWGETVIRRVFAFSLSAGSGDIEIMNEDGALVEEFVLDTSAVQKLLVFDSEQRHFEVYLDGYYQVTLEPFSDTDILLP